METPEDLNLDKLGAMAETLPWVIPKVFIMPAHQYVVKKELETTEQYQAFDALRVASTNHTKRRRAFFRAYKTRNSYIEIGEYRYWYSQIGAALMMNRSYRECDIENIRAEKDDHAVKNWTGRPYAWKREYGLKSENLHRYCNLLVVNCNSPESELKLLRHAAMVSRDAVTCWDLTQKASPVDPNITQHIQHTINGVAAMKHTKGSKTRNVSCTDEEMLLKATWMSHNDMNPERVATDLKLLSTATELMVERIYNAKTTENYLVQLTIPPAQN